MRTRKLITISLPPPLLEKAERVAEEESRTKSELFREALRFYVETREDRKKASREEVFALLGRVQSRTRSTRPREIRRLIREALDAARRQRRLPRP